MINKKNCIYALWSLLAMLALFSCGDEPEYFDHAAQYDTDLLIINEYIADNNLDAVNIDSLGVFIVFTELADSAVEEYPTVDSYITVGYKCMLLDSTVCDSTAAGDTYTMSLKGFIPGWQIAIPKMRAGDRATVLVPSYFAYRDYRYGIIPPNSVLMFDICLESFE